MSSKIRITAVIGGIALLAGGFVVSTATAQQGSPIDVYVDTSGQHAEAVVVQQARDELERAARAMQEIRVNPTFRLSSSFGRRSGGIAGRVLANAEELELTADQQEQIRGLQRDNRRIEIRRNADTEIAEMDLEEMMADDATDLDAIEAKMREIANLGVDERMARLRLDRAVEAILTEAQRDALEEMSPERVIFESLRR